MKKIPLIKNQKYLIINADDYGLHEDINRGIISSVENGLVNSISISACGKALNNGISEIKNLKNIDLGVHITFVEELPSSPIGDIKSILGFNDRLLPNYKILFQKYLLGKINIEELYIEGKNQIERIINYGIKPTHIDSHQHIHMFPSIWKILVRLAEEYSISFIRCSKFDKLYGNRNTMEILMAKTLNMFAKINSINGSGDATKIDTIGLAYAGKVNEHNLIKILSKVPFGISELVVHPGYNTNSLKEFYDWNFDWSNEVKALQSKNIKNFISSNSIKLINFTQTKDIINLF